jgi:hypothetical protein
MNRVELQKWFGHSQDTFANAAWGEGQAKNHFQRWVTGAGVSEKTKAAAEAAGCGVDEVFYPNVLQDDFFGEGIEQIEIAIEGLRVFGLKYPSADIQAAQKAILGLAKRHLAEVPFAENI